MNNTGFQRFINFFSAFVVVLACIMWGLTFQRLSPGSTQDSQCLEQLGLSGTAAQVVNVIAEGLMRGLPAGSSENAAPDKSSKKGFPPIQLLVLMMNAASVYFEVFALAAMIAVLAVVTGYTAVFSGYGLRASGEIRKYYTGWPSGFLCQLQKTILTLVKSMDGNPPLSIGTRKPVSAAPALSDLIHEVRVFFMAPAKRTVL
jgi:hypothetical protein